MNHAEYRSSPWFTQDPQEIRRRSLLKYTDEELVKELLWKLWSQNRLEGLSPEQLLRRLSPEERLAGLSAKKRLEGLSAKVRLAGLSPEQRLAGLSPRQRLAGLSLEQRAKLRKLLDSET